METDLSFKKIFPYALGIKIIAGLILGLVYFYIVKAGDTISYDFFGKKLAELFSSNPSKYFSILFLDDLPQRDYSYGYDIVWQPRAFFIVKLSSIFQVFCFGNYWLISVYFSLFSFLCTWFLVKKLSVIFPKSDFALVVAFFFYPSFIFWTSGVLKESIAWGGFCLVLAFVLSIVKSRKIDWLFLPGIFGLYLLLQTKYYFLAVIIPVFGLYLMDSLWKSGKKYWLSIPILFLLLFISTNIHYNLAINRLLQSIVNNHNLVFQANSLSAIQFKVLSPNLESFLYNFPKALFSGLFAPIIPFKNNYYILIQCLENLFLLVFFLSSIVYRVTKQIKLHKLEIYLFSFCLIVACFLAYSSPNYGALMRYKTIFLPFLVFLALKENYFGKGVQRQNLEF